MNDIACITLVAAPTHLYNSIVLTGLGTSRTRLSLSNTLCDMIDLYTPLSATGYVLFVLLPLPAGLIAGEERNLVVSFRPLATSFKRSIRVRS